MSNKEFDPEEVRELRKKFRSNQKLLRVHSDFITEIMASAYELGKQAERKDISDKKFYRTMKNLSKSL